MYIKQIVCCEIKLWGREKSNPIRCLDSHIDWIAAISISGARFSESLVLWEAGAIEMHFEFPAAGALELDLTTGTRLLGLATRYIIPSYIGQCLLFVSHFI